MDEKHPISTETLRRRFKRVNSDLADEAKPKLWEKICDYVLRNHEPDKHDGPPRWLSQNTLALIERSGCGAKAKGEYAGNVQGDRNGAIHRSARNIATYRRQRDHSGRANRLARLAIEQPDKLDEQRGEVERGGGRPRDCERAGAIMGRTGFGQDEARKPSSLLADPSALLRQTVSGWVSMLEENPTEEDLDGVSEALIIALECGGYPVTDLFKGRVDIEYGGEGGGRPIGDDILRKTILAQGVIIQEQTRKIILALNAKSKAEHETRKVSRKIEQNEFSVAIERHGYIS